MEHRSKVILVVLFALIVLFIVIFMNNRFCSSGGGASYVYVDSTNLPNNIFAYCDKANEADYQYYCMGIGHKSNYTITKESFKESLKPYTIAESRWFSDGCTSSTNITIYTEDGSHNANKEELDKFLRSYNETCSGCVKEIMIEAYF
ncbi:MAG: hypothetical protein ABIH65_01180 [Nanoarchaeota archaeon]